MQWSATFELEYCRSLKVGSKGDKHSYNLCYRGEPDGSTDY